MPYANSSPKSSQDEFLKMLCAGTLALMELHASSDLRGTAGTSCRGHAQCQPYVTPCAQCEASEVSSANRTHTTMAVQDNVPPLMSQSGVHTQQSFPCPHRPKRYD